MCNKLLFYCQNPILECSAVSLWLSKVAVVAGSAGGRGWVCIFVLEFSILSQVHPVRLFGQAAELRSAGLLAVARRLRLPYELDEVVDFSFGELVQDAKAAVALPWLLGGFGLPRNLFLLLVLVRCALAVTTSFQSAAIGSVVRVVVVVHATMVLLLGSAFGLAGLVFAGLGALVFALGTAMAP